MTPDDVHPPTKQPPSTYYGQTLKSSSMHTQVFFLLPVESLYLACIGPLFYPVGGFCTRCFTNPVAVLSADCAGCTVSP